MPHQFASLNCKHCNHHYCPVCHEVCPNCKQDGIEKDEVREYMKKWRQIDKRRKEEFEAKKKQNEK
jgi:hypothetical protein